MTDKKDAPPIYFVEDLLDEKRALLPDDILEEKIRFFLSKQDKVFECVYRTALDGSSRASYILGLMYQKGLGLTTHQHSAMSWFAQAYRQESSRKK